MGTETSIKVIFIEFSFFYVKLNNPQMGTETRFIQFTKNEGT